MSLPDLQTLTLRDGAELAYREHGNGDIVVISGQMMFGSAPSYESRLGDAGAHVYAVTLRGYRPSALADDDLGLGWLDRWADDIVEFATHIGVDRFFYSGASHGAGVGWYVARKYPDRLHGLISVVGAPHDRAGGTRSSRARQSLAAVPDDPVKLTEVYETEVFGIVPHPERAELRARRIAENVDHLLAMDTAELRINQGKPWPDARSDDELAAELAKVEVPTLLLNTMQDPIITPRAALRAVTSVPFSKAVLWQDEGHGVQEEAPERLVPETMLFIEEHMLRTATTEPVDRSAGPESATVEPHQRTFVTRDGATLSYVEHGSGETAILSAQMLFPRSPAFPSMLAEAVPGVRYLTQTLRGFAPSSTVPEDRGLEWLDQWSDDVIELADGLGIDRFIYAGASHGAGVGWYLAQKHPDRLRGFIGIVAGPHDRELDTSSSVTRRTLIDAWPDPVAVRRAYEELCFGPLLHPERADVRAARLDEYVDHFLGLSPEEARINQGKPWPEATTDEALVERLQQISVPTLLLSGMQDVIISPEASLRASQHVPGAKSVFWQAEGHCMEEENPIALVGEVKIWLAELEQKR